MYRHIVHYMYIIYFFLPSFHVPVLLLLLFLAVWTNHRAYTNARSTRNPKSIGPLLFTLKVSLVTDISFSSFEPFHWRRGTAVCLLVYHCLRELIRWSAE